MTTTTITTITRQTHVTMLKHLVAGHDLEFVAAATHVPRDTVLDIVSRHGYPDVKKMAWAVDILVKSADQIPEAQLRTGTPLDPASPATLIKDLEAERRNSLALTPPATIAHIPPGIADLLHQAEQSPFIRTQNMAAKISALLADLTARLNDEQQAVEAKAQADRESARIATRIATLQAEIDKLKRKPAKPVKTDTAGIATTPRESTRKYGLHPGEHSCPVTGCDRTFDTSQGVHLHQRRAHEGFNPNAGAA